MDEIKKICVDRRWLMRAGTMGRELRESSRMGQHAPTTQGQRPGRVYYFRTLTFPEPGYFIVVNEQS
jgi:hypothetical protein